MWPTQTDNFMYEKKTFSKFVKHVDNLNYRKNKRENRNFKKLIIVLLLILLLVLLLGSATKMLDDNSKEGAFASMTQQEKINHLNDLAKKSMVDVSVASNIVFPQGSTNSGTARFVNNSQNNLSQKYILRLCGDDEVLYESGIVKPGFWIDEISLNKDLEPGVKDAVVTVVAYDQDSNTEIGQVDAQVKLTVNQ